MKVQKQSMNTNGNSYDKAVLQKCKQTIEELQQQLNEARENSEQQQKLIDILSKQKQYYCQECKRHEQERSRLESERLNALRENETKRVLVNELKKVNQSLKDELYEVKENAEQNKFMFHAQQQQIERIKREKQILQKEWNRVIKQVKTKFVSQKYNYREEKSTDNLENMFNYSNMPRKDKVSKILQQIDKNLASKQIDSLIRPITRNQSSTNDILDISF